MPAPDPKETGTGAQPGKAELLEAVSTAEPKALADALAGIHPALLADVLEAMPPDQRLAVWSAAEHAVRGETLTELHDEVLRGLAAEADPVALGRAMAPLQPDELADLEPHVPAAAFEAALERLHRHKRLRLERVRSYAEDVAGGLMDVDAVTVAPEDTLADVLGELRAMRTAGEGLPEHLDSVYAVDDSDRLLGVIPLADIASHAPTMRIATIMLPAAGLPVEMPVADVVAHFRDQDLMSAPVVNEAGELLGRITVDDVMDEMSIQAERSILVPAGLDEERDLFAPLKATLRQRGLWLSINLVSAFVAAWVIGRFESTIEQLVALAVLMPVVASMGGVAGQQSLALVIRGLALNHVSRANRWRLLRHEMASGIVIGLLFAGLVAGVAHLWYGHAQLSAIIAVALVGNVFVGTSMGTVYPLVMKRLGIDPALAGGMALTATTDAVGFLALLGLAALVLF